jgi:hypothetical protein
VKRLRIGIVFSIFVNSPDGKRLSTTGNLISPDRK